MGFGVTQNILASVAGFVAFGAICYTVFALTLVNRFFSQIPVTANSFPDVSVFKPLHGEEWQLVENLESFLTQHYPGEVQYLFGVHDAQDTALAAVELLRDRYPDKQIVIVIDTRLYGPNRKISNLVNMLNHAKHNVLCFADSDV
nr:MULTISPECIES: glycosyltransferase [unclassified Paraburkholderia]